MEFFFKNERLYFLCSIFSTKSQEFDKKRVWRFKNIHITFKVNSSHFQIQITSTQFISHFPFLSPPHSTHSCLIFWIIKRSVEVFSPTLIIFLSTNSNLSNTVFSILSLALILKFLKKPLAFKPFTDIKPCIILTLK